MASLLAAAVALATTGSMVAAEPACAALEPGLTRTVTRVIDGETLALDDGLELRLAGALAPRGIDAGAEGTWQPEADAVETLRPLVLGKSIALAFLGAERSDRYGRMQAQVLVLGADGGRRWLQGELVERGLARAYTSAGHRGCSVELLAIERAARAGGRGLWREAAYQVRSADKPSELLRYRATFQLVEGRILRVSGGHGTLYLSFARNWRRGLSVSLRRSDRELLGSFADDPRGLEGVRARVRGWIEVRQGAPVIDLSTAGALEVLADGNDAKEAAGPEDCKVATTPEKRC